MARRAELQTGCVRAGRFAHVEHPKTARSWDTKFFQDFWRRTPWTLVRLNMSLNVDGQGLNKKPTRVATTTNQTCVRCRVRVVMTSRQTAWRESHSRRVGEGCCFDPGSAREIRWICRFVSPSTSIETRHTISAEIITVLTRYRPIVLELI